MTIVFSGHNAGDRGPVIIVLLRPRVTVAGTDLQGGIVIANQVGVIGLKSTVVNSDMHAGAGVIPPDLRHVNVEPLLPIGADQVPLTGGLDVSEKLQPIGV